MSTCAECGAAMDGPGEFHPYVFCVIKKAIPEMTPWEVFASAAEGLGITGLPERAPAIRDLPLDGIGTRAGQEQER